MYDFKGGQVLIFLGTDKEFFHASNGFCPLVSRKTFMFCFFSEINNPILLSVEFHILMDSLLFRLVRAALKKGANIILIQVGRLC